MLESADALPPDEELPAQEVAPEQAGPPDHAAKRAKFIAKFAELDPEANLDEDSLEGILTDHTKRDEFAEYVHKLNPQFSLSGEEMVEALGFGKKKAQSEASGAAGGDAAPTGAPPAGLASPTPTTPTLPDATAFGDVTGPRPGDQEVTQDEVPLPGGPAAVGVGDVPPEVKVPKPGIQQVPGEEYLAAGLPLPSGEELRAKEEARQLARQQEAGSDGFWASLGKSLYNGLDPKRIGGNLLDYGGDLLEYLTRPVGLNAADIPLRENKGSDVAASDLLASAGRGDLPLSEAASKSILTDPSLAAAGNLMGSGIASIIPVAAASAAGGPVAGLGMGAGLGISATKESARNAGISDKEAALTATVLAPIQGALEELGVGFITKNKALSSLLTKTIVGRALTEGAGKLSESAIAQAAKQLLPEVAKRSVGAGAGEAVTEFLQGEAEGVAKLVADQMRANPEAPAGQGRYGITPYEALVKSPAEQALGGLLIGSASGAVHTLPLGRTPEGRTLHAELNAQGQPTAYFDEQGPVDFGPQGPPPAVQQAVTAAQRATPAPLPAEQLLSHTKVPVLAHRGEGQLYADYDMQGQPTKLYSAKGQVFSLDDPQVSALVESKWPDAAKSRDASTSAKPAAPEVATPPVLDESPAPLAASEPNQAADSELVVADEMTKGDETTPKETAALQPLRDALPPLQQRGQDGAVVQAIEQLLANPTDAQAHVVAQQTVSQLREVNDPVLRPAIQALEQALSVLPAPEMSLPPFEPLASNNEQAAERTPDDATVAPARGTDTPDGANADEGVREPAATLGSGPDRAGAPAAAAGVLPESGTPVANTAAGTVSDSGVGGAVVRGLTGGESETSGSTSATPVIQSYATPAENRAAGAFEKDGQVYTRQAPLGDKVARGKQATAEFSSGVQQPVQYAVMEAADLQPSHLGGSQNPNHFLPEAQPKNRSAAFDPASQKAISDIAATPDLNRLGESPNAYSGAPIVNQRGEGLQGNGRSAGIREHYRTGGASYKQEVVVAAEKAGISAEQTTKFKEPVLVRIADVSDARARELGNYTAADTESGGKRRLDARQASGRMGEEDRATLTRLATPQGEATLTETIRGNAEALLRFLRKAGLVNETQLQTMAKADGTLTLSGVEDVAALYRHQLFRDGDTNLPELFAELPSAAQGGLDRAVGGLLSVPESASIVPDVQDALWGVREFLNSGTDFPTWTGQADMFKGGQAPRERYTPLTLKLIDVLATEKRPTYIARLFNEYAAAVKGEGASLFGETPPKTRAEAVKQTFGVPDAGNPRAEKSAPRPGDADQRPPAPEPPAAPGPAAAAEPAAAPAVADNPAQRAGRKAAAAQPAAEGVGEMPAVRREFGGYVARDGTRFTGTGAKARAETHSREIGLVGKRARSYGGGTDTIEKVAPNPSGTGYVYTVRDEQGQTRTHGSGYTDQDVALAAKDDARASGPKFYADQAEAPPVMNQPGRIAPDPIRGETPKAQDKIILDVRQGTGFSLFFSKRPGGRKSSRALGSYNPRNAAIAVRASADLDVTAHELGHALDDHYEVLPKAAPAQLAEIAPLAQFGSQPPAGHPDPQHYRNGEALAEFVRAYLVNPDATRAAYPEFTQHYETTVPAKLRASVEAFGRDLRVYAGATAHEQVMSNVRMKPVEKGGILGLLKPETTGKQFRLTFGDKVQATMLNALHPFEKAMRYAQEVTGQDLLPSENPTVLARLFLGLNDKMDNQMRYGLVDSRNDRRLDSVSGEVKNLTWLLDPLDKTTEGTIGHEQELVISSKIARRTVELVDRRIAEEIEAAHARGESVPDALLQQNPAWQQQYGPDNARLKAQPGNVEAVIDEHQTDTVSGIGAGVFTDLAVARQRLADHDALALSNPAQHARIEEAGRRYESWADDNLRYLLERGRISQEQYDAIKEQNAQYIAMQRIMEAEPGAEIEVLGRGPGGKSFTAVKQPLQKITGSGRTIKNPYSSLLDATYRVTREGDRNAIMQSFRELFTGSRVMYDGQPEQLGSVARPAAEGDPHTVSVFVGGQREYWQLDADVFQALNDLSNTPLTGPLAQVLQAPSKLLRWSVTNSPVFAVRNLIRDTRSRLIISTNKPESGFDLLTNKQARTEARDSLDLAGGGQAGHYLSSETAYYDTMQQTMRSLARDKRFILADPGAWAKGAWHSYTALLGGSETIGRRMEYRAAFKAARAKGLDDYNASLHAALEARDLMDFAVAGTFLREVNKYVPFTNAAVQGLRRAARSAKENPGGFAARWTLYSLLPTLLVRGLIHKMGRDDEYAQLPAYQRDGFDNIPLPKGKWLVIPRPFELGTLAASSDRFLSQQVAADPHAWEGYGGSLAKSFVPVDESAVAGGLKPVVEVLTNHDFFKDKTIISPSEAKLDVDLRHTERGSRLGQWIGGAVGMDSRNVDHLISGTGSYYGNWLMKASNFGREDGMSFGLPDTGFIKDQPVTQARDVQWLQQRLEGAGLGQSQPARDLEKLLQAYYAQKTDADRQQVGHMATAFAKTLRTFLDAQTLKQVGRAQQARRARHRP